MLCRVVAEASDINDLQRAGWAEDARVDSRVESFCMEKSGHDPCLDTKHGFCGDQGAVFFTPNATWAQPPFYVHQMIVDTPGQDLLLSASVAVRMMIRIIRVAVTLEQLMLPSLAILDPWGREWHPMDVCLLTSAPLGACCQSSGLCGRHSPRLQEL